MPNRSINLQSAKSLHNKVEVYPNQTCIKHQTGQLNYCRGDIRCPFHHLTSYFYRGFSQYTSCWEPPQKVAKEFHLYSRKPMILIQIGSKESHFLLLKQLLIKTFNCSHPSGRAPKKINLNVSASCEHSASNYCKAEPLFITR